MTTLEIPSPFRPYTDGNKIIELQNQNVQEALEWLTTEHPSLREHLFDEHGTLRKFVNLFLNGEDIRYLQGTGTRLHPGDKLQLIPSIAGGNRDTSPNIPLKYAGRNCRVGE
ncbi:MAG: MoaD/ThiS family protein [Chloroflexi bacterium]|nr:MoaD/ThiS family protein [Chloroflexota bacterium]